MKHLKLKEITGNEETNNVYHLEPNFNQDYYSERVNRNIGWITQEEQNILLNSTVGIAGCGGMGGLVAVTLLRLGVGKIKISDIENFDISNLNRQFGANKLSIGKSKALETAKMMRDISDDTEIIVYPSGITEETVDDFLSDCDLVCDEIEFWALGSKILLHQKAREEGIPILSCNTVGHQTNLMYFDRDSFPLEDYLGFNLEEALSIQEKIQDGTALKQDVGFVMNRIAETLVPSRPSYDLNNEILNSVLKRLEQETSASIIATNPPFASGFLSNHVLFQLLKKSPLKRDIILPPKFPGYLSIDAALLKAERIIKD